MKLAPTVSKIYVAEVDFTIFRNASRPSSLEETAHVPLKSLGPRLAWSGHEALTPFLSFGSGKRYLFQIVAHNQVSLSAPSGDVHVGQREWSSALPPSPPALSTRTFSLVVLSAGGLGAEYDVPHIATLSTVLPSTSDHGAALFCSPCRANSWCSSLFSVSELCTSKPAETSEQPKT